jgi:hypothetical protein
LATAAKQTAIRVNTLKAVLPTIRISVLLNS